jgi:dienelactone hydrolase
MSHMAKETLPHQPKTWLWLLVTLVMFFNGCTVLIRPTPVDIAPPSPTATNPTPIATFSPVPSATVPTPNPLERAWEALRAVSSVRIRITYYEGSTSKPTTRLWTSEIWYRPGPPEVLHIHSDWGDGLVDESICHEMANREQCWSQVGQHPWTRWADIPPTWLEQLQQELASTTISSSTILSGSNQVLVKWRRPIPSGQQGDELFLIGQTWLDAKTYLPIREIVTEQSLTEPTIYHSETIYSDYDVPLTIATPAAATVTPVPTVPFTPWAPGRDKPTREEPLPCPGVLVVPDQPGSFPAVVVLHGSEGSLHNSLDVAQELAEKGFMALALCYFGCPQTPEKLQSINIEQVTRAVDYLRNRPDVRPEAIALLGLSRGAELALIVGALDPDVHAVISVMGVPWVVSGYPSGGTAWLYQGQPLPFHNIPVEQINGPVLLIHGERDGVWPVDHAYLLADRLAAHSHPYELAVYSDRGHDIGVSPLDAFNRMVAFLERTLL